VATFKENHRGTQVRLNSRDGALVYNHGTGIHILLPPHLAETIHKVEETQDPVQKFRLLQSLSLGDSLFLRLYMAYLDLQEEYDLDMDVCPGSEYS